MISSSSARAKWQHEVASRVESFQLFRCWFGTLGGVTRMEAQLLGLTLLWRLHQPRVRTAKTPRDRKKGNGRNKQLVAGEIKNFIWDRNHDIWDKENDKRDQQNMGQCEQFCQKRGREKGRGEGSLKGGGQNFALFPLQRTQMCCDNFVND